MKKKFLFTLFLAMIYSPATASQKKIKEKSEPIIFVQIKRLKAQQEMLSFAFTQGQSGYRMHELLSGSKYDVTYYTFSPFLKSQAGSKRLMYTLTQGASFNSEMRNLLNKAMSAAQKLARSSNYDNTWSFWHYKNGTVEFKNSKLIPKEWLPTPMNAPIENESNSNQSGNEDDSDSVDYITGDQS